MMNSNLKGFRAAGRTLTEPLLAAQPSAKDKAVRTIQGSVRPHEVAPRRPLLGVSAVDRPDPVRWARPPDDALLALLLILLVMVVMSVMDATLPRF
jgi:hypothetical protein